MRHPPHPGLCSWKVMFAISLISVIAGDIRLLGAPGEVSDPFPSPGKLSARLPPGLDGISPVPPALFQCKLLCLEAQF